MPLMTSTGALSTRQLNSLQASISRLQSTVSAAPVDVPAQPQLPAGADLNQPNCGTDPTAFSAQERRRREQHCGVPEEPDELNQPNCATSPSTMTATERARWQAYCGVPEQPSTSAWVRTPPTRLADPGAPPPVWRMEALDDEFRAVKNAWGERLWATVVDEISATLEPPI